MLKVFFIIFVLSNMIIIRIAIIYLLLSCVLYCKVFCLLLARFRQAIGYLTNVTLKLKVNFEIYIAVRKASTCI